MPHLGQRPASAQRPAFGRQLRRPTQHLERPGGRRGRPTVPAHLDHGQPVGPLRGVVLQGQLTRPLEEHVDHHPLRGSHQHPVDELLALHPAAVPTDQLHPRPGHGQLNTRVLAVLVSHSRTTSPTLVHPRGDRLVTWEEFVEAGLLREYRRTHRVPMAELRTFIDLLREKLGVPYPLAHQKPFVSEGRQLVLATQDASGLEADYCLVAVTRGQLILTPPAEAFVERVTWEDDIAAGWRPHEDPDSPVRMAPDIRFGLPSVKGISTAVLWEHVDAGEGIEEVAEAFDLAVSDVHWALAYENSLHAAA
jgi:uncharacterized protein (DUF433 family)